MSGIYSAGDLVVCTEDINGHVGRHIDGLDGGYGIGQRNLEGRMLSQFCLEKDSCVSNTLFKRKEKRKVTFRIGENEKRIVCVHKEKTPMIYAKCEGNPLGVSTFISGRIYR